MQRIPTLIGIRGHFKGEVFPLEYGKTMVIGRSRTADFSIKRTERYRAQTPEERESDEAAHTVSAKHFQITMYNLRSIEVKNLSPNGTRLDGQPVETVVLEDLSSRSHKIAFGLEEVFSLEMRMHEN
ncbi:MAG TPA: FHA domain-containing protein [Planctomycetota bacterium]|jgi:pSer/pThr/pTyr-binding forkhead associated (FHA) protein